MTDQMHPAERARRYSRACGLRESLLYPPDDAPPLPEPSPDWWHVWAFGAVCAALLVGYIAAIWPDLRDNAPVVADAVVDAVQR